jgi:quercetin dioxygenase-like cupin family protein
MTDEAAATLRSRVGTSSDLDRDEPYPGIRRASLHTPVASFARYELAPAASFPRHHHPQSQLLFVERGSVAFELEGETHAVGANGWAVVPPDATHGITAGDDGATAFAIVVPGRAGASDYVVVDQPGRGSGPTA